MPRRFFTPACLVHRPRRLLAGLLLLIALLLASVPGAALAAPGQGRPVNPHTPVASDGEAATTAPDASIVRGKGEAYSPSAEGTGALVERGRRVTADPDVEGYPQEGASPESVIGADGRYQITGTTTYPYRAIAHITTSRGGCTGWLIGVDTVATAGHCVHSGGSGGTWATSVRVYPGRNGSSTPYGSCGAVRLYSVTGWTQSGDRNYDYGAIKLNCTIGNNTGWFGYRWQSASLTGQPTYLAGYPGDKPYATMWRHDDTVRITQTYRLYYANDTFGGQSGSPVWNGSSSTCNPCGVAIHAYGVDGTGYNGGTRITESVFNNLASWKNAPR